MVAATDERGSRGIAIGDTYRRAVLAHKKCFYMLDTGHVGLVRAATRDTDKYLKNEIVVPENAKYLCVEGDREWQPLPGHTPTSVLKEREAAKRKLAAAAERAADEKAPQPMFAETRR